MEPTQIVHELKRMGMTQKEIADAIGSHQSTISEIQNGKQSRPTYQVVSKLNELYQQKLIETGIEPSDVEDDTQALGGTSNRKIKEAQEVSI